ncbi:MAG: hypothetical protein GX963_10185 [Bacteroidales bacterium]|nr:hypothetical protein [Bacteroidales bacterium]
MLKIVNRINTSRLTTNQEVAGSNPAGRTKKPRRLATFGVMLLNGKRKKRREIGTVTSTLLA